MIAYNPNIGKMEAKGSDVQGHYIFFSGVTTGKENKLRNKVRPTLL